MIPCKTSEIHATKNLDERCIIYACIINFYQKLILILNLLLILYQSYDFHCIQTANKLISRKFAPIGMTYLKGTVQHRFKGRVSSFSKEGYPRSST